MDAALYIVGEKREPCYMDDPVLLIGVPIVAKTPRKPKMTPSPKTSRKVERKLWLDLLAGSFKLIYKDGTNG